MPIDNDSLKNGMSQLMTDNGPVSFAKGAIPIAICGMALRLPGGLSSPRDLWEFLLAKGDARDRVPKSRYNVYAYYSPEGTYGSVATEYGYFLDEGVDLGALDTSFFSMTRNEVERADPQQRLLLEVARECFEDAGVTKWRGKTIGCYVGSFGEDWVEMFAREPQQYGIHRVVGIGDFALSNRISYEMDLQGPSMTLRTACSSGLTGLNEACMAISRGDCEAALVAGVNLILGPGMTIAMTEQGVLSKDGCCKTFSADANGYARGEAVTALYIKPLMDAIRDGNPVRAVIRGTASNGDGKTPGMSQPSTDAQEKLIRRAYEVAGITDFKATAVVECHGTGTAIGDPIEVKAVARVFGDEGVYITSVKPNLGHAEGASGLVSVIKMVLALEKRIIPPNIRFSSPNPNIPFESARLTVPVEATSWPTGKVARTSVNSFGIGGSNAHVILDSAEMFNVGFNCRHASTRAQLLLHSANSPKSLERLVKDYSAFAESNPDSAVDLAYTLAFRREALPYRSFTIMKDGAVGSPSTTASSPDDSPPSIVMVFTGQGAQWPLMGRELLGGNSVFQASIRSLNGYLDAITGDDAPGYSIEEELLKPGKRSRVGTARLSQPLCTAVQIALVDTLKSLGIVPATVVGHSSGEIAAAYAAGGLTAREAILTAHFRGVSASRQQRSGAMAAVGMSWVETEKFLVPGTKLACENSPNSVTISGDAGAVHAVIDDIKESVPDVLARLLQVDKAYHSGHMVEVGDYYLDCLSRYGVTGRQPTVAKFVSSVTGGFEGEAVDLSPEYWRRNLELPVRFCSAVSAILEDATTGKSPAFIEVGPHSALAGPLRQIFTSISTTSSTAYVASLVRNQDSMGSLLVAAGKLWSLRVPIKLESLIPTGNCLSDLPRYPWSHETTHWYESRLSKEWRQRTYPHHNLLGSKVPQSTDLEPAWRNLFHLESAPWVQDHRLDGDVVFPFAAYLATAGEAISQITGVDHGFRIRNMNVRLALVLPESKPTEIITTLRPIPLNRSLNSQWWEFTVSSYNGQTWNKHCVGEVIAVSSEVELENAVVPSLPRKVSASCWYATMRKTGLGLGPAFQTMRALESSVRGPDNRAVARVEIPTTHEKGYHIHPTVLDGTLQLMSCAATNGQARRVKNWLPTSIERITVRRCTSALTSCVSAKTTSRSIVGYGHCISEVDGMTYLEVSGIRMSLGGGPDSNDMADTHAAARLTWRPDIDFTDISSLSKASVDRASQVSLLNELTRLCLCHDEPKALRPEQPSDNLSSYARWITRQEQTLRAERNLSTATNRNSIVQTLTAWVKRLSGTPAAAAVAILRNVFCNLHSILLGEHLFDKDLPDDFRENLKVFMSSFEMTDFVRHICHSQPNLRVLEIGEDSLVPAPAVTQGLVLASGDYSCMQYTFTSKGYISTKDQVQLFPGMEFLTLDISKDLDEQGFENRQYDLIVSSNMTRPVIPEHVPLENIRKLLAPRGRLILQGNSNISLWASYVFGSQTRSWSGINTTNDSDHKCTRGNALRKSLAAVGLVSIDCLAEDEISTTVVASLALDKVSSKTVSVLYTDAKETERIDDPVILQLQKSGYHVSKFSIQSLEELPPDQDVLCLLDRTRPYFENLSPPQLRALQILLGNMGNAGLFWSTMACQIGCSDPRYAPVIGFARTMRSEMLVDFATCELEDWEKDAQGLVRVFEKFQRRGSHTKDGLKPDFEFVLKQGQVHVGRYYPFSLSDELNCMSTDENAALDIGTPGRVNTLRWSQSSRETPKDSEVELNVHAAGLNFRDILVAMNIVELPTHQFGLEAAGVITRLGPSVKNLKIGDRVVCLSKSAFSRFLCVPEFACAKVPSSVSLDEASCMLVPYVTAIHSLVNVGRLVEGQSVLIHSACGGVGLAAVQIAQMCKAVVYTSVGSEDKVQYLNKEFNIPMNHIFHSRDDSFVVDLMRETNGRGVDLILNSLSGELLHATWSCVAEFGTMVEIGKRDLINGAKLDMRPFLANRSYCCVDIDQLWRKPDVLEDLIRSTVKFCEEGRVNPVRPVTFFSANDVQEAFRFMQKGQHIGRVALTFTHAVEDRDFALEVVPQQDHVTFSESTSYLLVGGLGGLGQAVSRWMVEQGARELIYLSRSAGKDSKAGQFVEEIESMGCRVNLISGDVTKPGDVARATAAASYPLKGILQMSMVLRDQNFEKMTFEEWHAAVAPKVQGTWNLHHATLDAELDFFLMFSSISGVVGQPGQANYASANTFLDCFAQYRESLGLPVSVVDIGAVADVGVISQTQGMLNKMISTGFRGVSEQDLLDGIAISIARSRTKVTAGVHNPALSWSAKGTFVLGLGSDTPLSCPGNRAIWRNDRRMAVYHNKGHGGNAAGAGESSSQALKAALARARGDMSALSSPEFEDFLAMEIGKKLFDLLLKPYEELDMDRSLVDLGLDSLVAIEVRAWWKQVFGFDISVLDMLGAGSLRVLGQRAVEGLLAVVIEVGALG